MHRNEGRSVRASQEAEIQESRPEQRWKIRAGIAADAGPGSGKRGAVSGRVGGVGTASRQSRERSGAAPGPPERQNIFFCACEGPLASRPPPSLGGNFEASWEPFGSSMGAVLGSLGASRGPLGPAGRLVGRLGAVLGHLGRLSGRLGAILGCPGPLFGLSCGPPGSSWAPLGPSWARLEPSLGPLGGLLGRSWRPLGPFWTRRRAISRIC